MDREHQALIEKAKILSKHSSDQECLQHQLLLQASILEELLKLNEALRSVLRTDDD